MVKGTVVPHPRWNKLLSAPLHLPHDKVHVIKKNSLDSCPSNGNDMQNKRGGVHLLSLLHSPSSLASRKTVLNLLYLLLIDSSLNITMTHGDEQPIESTSSIENVTEPRNGGRPSDSTIATHDPAAQEEKKRNFE